MSCFGYMISIELYKLYVFLVFFPVAGWYQPKKLTKSSWNGNGESLNLTTLPLVPFTPQNEDSLYLPILFMYLIQFRNNVRKEKICVLSEPYSSGDWLMRKPPLLWSHCSQVRHFLLYAFMWIPSDWLGFWSIWVPCLPWWMFLMYWWMSTLLHILFLFPVIWLATQLSCVCCTLVLFLALLILCFLLTAEHEVLHIWFSVHWLEIVSPQLLKFCFLKGSVLEVFTSFSVVDLFFWSLICK